jgi:hypothetical protein
MPTTDAPTGYRSAGKALHWLTVGVTFFAALLAHLALVAWRGLLPRMLPEVRAVTGA